MFQRTNTITFFICSLFASAAIARHAHRKPLHRHAPRSEVTSTAIVVDDEPQQIPTSSTLGAPGDAVLDDILKIQTGLNDLPEDLLAIISSLEHRLSEIENVLAGYVDEPALPTSTDSPVGPVGPVLAPAPPAPASPNAPEENLLPTDPSSELPSTVTVTVSTDSPATTSLIATTEPETTSYMKTRSTRITRTLTLVTTIPAPLATGIINNNDTLPAVNGTSSFEPPAPWTRPYLVSGFTSSVRASSTVESGVSSDLVKTSPMIKI